MGNQTLIYDVISFGLCICGKYRKIKCCENNLSTFSSMHPYQITFFLNNIKYMIEIDYFYRGILYEVDTEYYANTDKNFCKNKIYIFNKLKYFEQIIKVADIHQKYGFLF